MRFLACRRIALAFGLLVTVSAAIPVAASAYDLSSVQKAAGVWELSRDNGARKCSVQLRNQQYDGGYALTLPAQCKISLPAIATVSNWRLSPDRVEFDDRRGVPVLTFAAADDGLTAIGPGGESYLLRNPADVAKGGRPGGRIAAAPSNVPPQARPAEIPGRYSVLRDGAKDTGCMLTLQPGSKAQLAPACRDNGFVVFDPQSWVYANGKLRLTARKGHHAFFERAADGTWQKDPKEGGKPLGFRKM
jgi:hypothetical protein